MKPVSRGSLLAASAFCHFLLGPWLRQYGRRLSPRAVKLLTREMAVAQLSDPKPWQSTAKRKRGTR